MELNVLISEGSKSVELKCLANFLNELAIARDGKEVVKKPVTASVIEKVAEHISENVVEAPAEVKEETVIDEDKEIIDMNEKELMNVPVADLIKFLKREFNIDAEYFAGKNTNAKLRKLVLDAKAGKIQGIDEPVDDVDMSDLEPQEDSATEEAVTIDLIREKARNIIRKDKAAVAAAFKECGAKSLGDLMESKYEKFYKLISKI